MKIDVLRHGPPWVFWVALNALGFSANLWLLWRLGYWFSAWAVLGAGFSTGCAVGAAQRFGWFAWSPR